MRVLQLLKIPYTTLPHLLHFKILQKLPLLSKIHHIHNLLSIILLNLFTLPLLFKIYQLNKLLSSVLLHMFIL
jgi:hypothetical protein